MVISIEALSFEVIIGILDFEREKPQQIIIDLSLSYDYQTNHFIDYAHIVSFVKKHMHEKKYGLLEDALFGIKNVLLSHYPHIKTLTAKITKPDILKEAKVAVSESWIFQT